MLYNALWYFPILIVAGGFATIIWDYRWIQRALERPRRRGRGRQHDSADAEGTQLEEQSQNPPTAGPSHPDSAGTVRHRECRTAPTKDEDETNVPAGKQNPVETSATISSADGLIFSWKFGVFLITSFFAVFAVLLVVRSVHHDAS